MTKPGWTRENLRHGLAMLRHGRRPAATVYDSLGTDFFLALDRGWLNLGLWEGDGSDLGEAPKAVRALVARIAEALPRRGDVLDVGNGLGEQDRLISDLVSPSSLTALNVTLSQLRAGRAALLEAATRPVNGDACRMPFASGSFDGLISVEAAFHFPSRRRFFQEAYRVLRPGGVLTMSDIPTLRYPSGPREALAGLALIRAWGLRRTSAASPDQIVGEARTAGFRDVESELVGERTIGPALRFVRGRLGEHHGADRSYVFAARTMVAQADLLWRRRMIDYQLIRARR